MDIESEPEGGECPSHPISADDLFVFGVVCLCLCVFNSNYCLVKPLRIAMSEKVRFWIGLLSVQTEVL